MLDQLSYLLIDIGNSRIKFACVQSFNDELSVKHCTEVSELETIIEQSKKVLVASVGKIVLVEEIRQICTKHNVECFVAAIQSQQFGITCAYKQFENLGIDRWLAVLAARSITSDAVAVLDLGTANTCDIVVGNQHIGGWIAPGFSLMKQSLLTNTQKVFADASLPESLEVGTTTPSCVNNGCLSAIHGFVAMAEKYLSNSCSEYKIFVTGGDQSLLFSIKNSHLRFFPNLVLLGLQRFI
ncbi:MAG: type III pantothenate kinase [Paraglaciecola sp.]|nr:type III pantothenate kinase [Paraglaciecola sp.]